MTTTSVRPADPARLTLDWRCPMAFHACTRCGGDMTPEAENPKHEMRCMNCGARRYDSKPEPIAAGHRGSRGGYHNRQRSVDSATA